MRVRCVSNVGADLPADYLSDRYQVSRESHFHVTPGMEYEVYGIVSFVGGFWYYLADDSFSYYPVWNPAPLFEIIDGSIPKDWRVGTQGTPPVDMVITYPEWAGDPTYYERLIDREPDAVAAFERRRSRDQRRDSNRP